MESFKIIQRTDNKVKAEKPAIAADKKPVTVADETKYISARCKKTQKDFIIRLSREDGAWYLVNAFRDELTGSGAAQDTTVSFDGGLYVGKGYSCPDCGTTQIVRCSVCGKVTCYDGKNFVCAYCGNGGAVKGTIDSLSALSLGHGKKK